MNRNISFSHSNGTHMRFCTSITNFLAERKGKSNSFYLGHWLESMADENLQKLRDIVMQFKDGSHEMILDDIVSVVLISLAAETRKPKQELSPERLFELIGGLYICASMESYRRRGWLELDSTLSIKPHKKVVFRLTELGKKQGAQIQTFT